MPRRVTPALISLRDLLCCHSRRLHDNRDFLKASVGFSPAHDAHAAKVWHHPVEEDQFNTGIFLQLLQGNNAVFSPHYLIASAAQVMLHQVEVELIVINGKNFPLDARAVLKAHLRLFLLRFAPMPLQPRPIIRKRSLACALCAFAV